MSWLDTFGDPHVTSNPLAEMEQAQRMQNRHNASQQLSSITMAGGGGGGVTVAPSPQGIGKYTPLPNFAALTEKALAHDAFDTPLETLVNLWLSKYGDGWINKALIVQDEFFSLAAQRLIKLGRMEEYNMVHEGKVVLRVVP